MLQKSHSTSRKKLNFLDYLKIEFLKAKRGRLLPILFIAPLLVVFSGISSIKLYFTPEYPNPWAAMFIQSSLLFAFYLLPLSMIVICIMLVHREKQTRGILKMLALPIDKRKMVVAKFAVLVSYLALELLIFFMVFVAAGIWATSSSGISQAVPVMYLLKWSCSIFVTMLPSMAVMLGITITFKKLFASIGLNVLLTLPGILFSASSVWYLFPYCYSGHLVSSAIHTTSTAAYELPFDMIPFLPVASVVFIAFILLSITNFGKHEMR